MLSAGGLGTAGAAGVHLALKPLLRDQVLHQSTQGLTSHVLCEVLDVRTQGKW